MATENLNYSATIRIGIVPKGTWNENTTYNFLDLVNVIDEDGRVKASYLAKQNNIQGANKSPTNTSYWFKIVERTEKTDITLKLEDVAADAKEVGNRFDDTLQVLDPINSDERVEDYGLSSEGIEALTKTGIYTIDYIENSTTTQPVTEVLNNRRTTITVLGNKDSSLETTIQYYHELPSNQLYSRVYLNDWEQWKEFISVPISKLEDIKIDSTNLITNINTLPNKLNYLINYKSNNIILTGCPEKTSGTLISLCTREYPNNNDAIQSGIQFFADNYHNNYYIRSNNNNVWNQWDKIKVEYGYPAFTWSNRVFTDTRNAEEPQGIMRAFLEEMNQFCVYANIAKDPTSLNNNFKDQYNQYYKPAWYLCGSESNALGSGNTTRASFGNTYCSSPSGLWPETTTCAKDLNKIVTIAASYQKIREVCQKDYYLLQYRKSSVNNDPNTVPLSSSGLEANFKSMFASDNFLIQGYKIVAAKTGSVSWDNFNYWHMAAVISDRYGNKISVAVMSRRNTNTLPQANNWRLNQSQAVYALIFHIARRFFGMLNNEPLNNGQVDTMETLKNWCNNTFLNRNHESNSIYYWFKYYNYLDSVPTSNDLLFSCYITRYYDSSPAYIFNATDEATFPDIIATHNSSIEMPSASTMKLLTAIISCQHIYDWDEFTTVGEFDYRNLVYNKDGRKITGSLVQHNSKTIWFDQSDNTQDPEKIYPITITLDGLLHAVLMQSDNIAATALARVVGTKLLNMHKSFRKKITLSDLETQNN